MKLEEDVVYGGNIVKWVKFVNFLKLCIVVCLLVQNESKVK